MSKSEIRQGRVLAIEAMSCGKQIVWPVYLNWPPRAWVTCKIGLTRAMSISSIWVKEARKNGWSPGSMLFAMEKRWVDFVCAHR